MTIWEPEQHSAGKHLILQRYLDAWIPIIGRSYQRVILVDGFAGPGRYTNGERGSPMIMLDAYRLRKDVATLRAQFSFLFIENRKDRAAELEREVNRVRPSLPKGTVVAAGPGDFEEVMTEALGKVANPTKVVPTFVFIDPFGYADTSLQITSRIMGLPHCEVLVFLPTPFIARFVDEASSERAATNLFDGEEWMEARSIPDLDGRKAFLHDLFAAKLREQAAHVRSFEVLSTGVSGYHLFFATNHLLGLQKMKEAMWRADPSAGERFRDSTVIGQEMLFEPAGDLGLLRADLRRRFEMQPFSIEDAESFTLIDTAFLPGRHLKVKTLSTAETEGLLEVVNAPGSRRRATYPPGTILRFKR